LIAARDAPIVPGMRRLVASVTLAVLLAVVGAVVSLVAPGTGAGRRVATAVGYYDASTPITVDNHGCGNAGAVTAFGVFWIGGAVPRAWLSTPPGVPGTPHSGTMHRTSFSHAVFTAGGGGTVEFTHRDRVFFGLECVIQ